MSGRFTRHETIRKKFSCLNPDMGCAWLRGWIGVAVALRVQDLGRFALLLGFTRRRTQTNDAPVKV